MMFDKLPPWWLAATAGSAKARTAEATAYAALAARLYARG